MKFSHLALFLTIVLTICLTPTLGFCTVESTLAAVQSRLIDVIMPMAGILGLCFAALSFFTGNAGARGHMWLAILGACVGFGAPSIIGFIHGLVH